MAYLHQMQDGSRPDLPVGKVVCVGRNYAEHARELNNPVPSEPLLFIKPATAVVPLEEALRLPVGLGQCHFETEVAILIGRALTGATSEEARAGIAGIGLGLDLTLRDLQDQLKGNGHPWEKAKAFDGACPLSPFVAPAALEDLSALRFSLQVNGEIRQQGDTGQMLTPVLELLAYCSRYFTLAPGDVVLTGTPAGVGPVVSGDQLVLRLGERVSFQTRVL